jgi:integrase
MPNEKEDNHVVIYDVTEGIASPETHRKYSYNFKLFLKHFDILPELLLQKDPKILESYVIQWIKHLSTVRKQRHDTIHNEVAAVLHWLEWNDIIVNKRKINMSIPQDAELRQDRHYSHEEIQRILDKCDDRNRVMILLMASTGMRLGALPDCNFSSRSNKGIVLENRSLTDYKTNNVFRSFAIVEIESGTWKMARDIFGSGRLRCC